MITLIMWRDVTWRDVVGINAMHDLIYICTVWFDVLSDAGHLDGADVEEQVHHAEHQAHHPLYLCTL